MKRSSVSNFFVSKNIFIYSCLLVTFAFLVTRLPYFVDFPVIILSSDTSSYCAVALKMLDGKLPVFDIRTPGYPVFLFLIWTFSKSVFTVSLIQSFFTLASVFFFLFVINKTYKRFVFLFAIALVGYFTSPYFILLETAILSEGIYPGLFLINSGLMILALKDNKNMIWIAYSLSLAALILVRPASLFLIGIIVMIMFYFWINKFKLRNYGMLIFPFACVILLLCSYNYFTINKFTITPFGEANLSGATILFMEESPEYSEIENAAIRKTLEEISEKDILYVKNSSGISKLYYSFYNNFFRQLSLTENLMKQDTSLSYVDIQPVIRKISIDAIKKHPDVYAKFFYSNFLFFFNNVKVSMNYFDYLSVVFKKTILDDKYIKELDSEKWKQISGDKSDNEAVKKLLQPQISKLKSLENFEVNQNGNATIRETFLKKVYMLYSKVYDLVFRNLLWLILYGVVFCISIFLIFKTGFKSADVFIPFLFCMIYLMKAILVSLVESSLVRYSYPVEFVIYFSLPFLFILLYSLKSDKSAENKAGLSSAK